ncbi:hypothetical protein CEXT_472621 [Caerostris extrusa]|uniref:Uncharacterized protein n=1 Tax=Caerostris extrusa TaxID=172846 RepID=A0AAV4T3Z7_CAEEX|nr:hypothetical protein CEXT_472621 [Caerostris extrusa]
MVSFQCPISGQDHTFFLSLPRSAHWLSLDTFVRDHCCPSGISSPQDSFPGEKWSMMSPASGFVDHDSLLSEILDQCRVDYLYSMCSSSLHLTSLRNMGPLNEV